MSEPAGAVEYILTMARVQALLREQGTLPVVAPWTTTTVAVTPRRRARWFRSRGEAAGR